MDRETSARLTATPTFGRVDVLGVGISAVNMTSAVAQIARWIDQGDRRYVCVTGVHGVMESQRDPELRQIHNRSGLTTPDGMPMVWAGRWAGVSDMTRVYGPDLMLRVCEAGLEQGWRHFFYGGSEGVANELAVRLGNRFPGLKVAGVHTPPFRLLEAAEVDEVVSTINAADPDLVWVGLSTPKQELWMSSLRPKLEAAVLLGVGAAFDINSGRASQAPTWMQKGSLEWAYRLAREPRRLWRRYLRNNPEFLIRVLWNPPRLIDPEGR